MDKMNKINEMNVIIKLLTCSLFYANKIAHSFLIF